MRKAPEWNKEALLQSPLFAPLHPILSKLEAGNFPAPQDCNALLLERSSRICVQNGRPLLFVAQQNGKLPFEAQYEPRCYLKGEVQTRVDNWHDLLNALVWVTFPKTKSAINARHYHALTSGAGLPTNAGRGAVRDVNTLLDESGVVVAYADAELAALLRNFKWKELFWQRREQVRAGHFDRLRTGIGFYLFGHGLYEKALQPYVGMTGQGLLLPVEQVFFSWPPVQQVVYLDSLMADYLAAPGNCSSTRELFPVPLLGVPGWSADNEREPYYDNTAYFRTRRRG